MGRGRWWWRSVTGMDKTMIQAIATRVGKEAALACLAEHPEYAAVGSNVFVDIFTAGMIAGLLAAEEVVEAA